MKIENEIQQTSFANVWIKATINLLFTNNWVEERLKELVEPYGITLQQFNVLRILRGQYPQKVSTCVIRERMIDRMSDSSRIVDRLNQKGLVQKSPCKSDRRLVDVVISDAGLEILAEIDNYPPIVNGVFQNLSAEEAELLNTLLDKIRETKP
jgi:DNA-binding MarR family transcriptional regulator